jgi:hypothetical protein
MSISIRVQQGSRVTLLTDDIPNFTNSNRLNVGSAGRDKAPGCIMAVQLSCVVGTL